MIATTFIILTYSIAIPFLYLAGLLVFTTMYWTDKTLFLSYMSTPPKYTTELARRSYFILEWAIVIHLFFGLILMTNPLVFNPD
jgi:hypothetical protein